MGDTSPDKIESPLASIGLVALIILPCLLQVLVLRFFDGPGTGDMWMPIYYGLTAICSALSALGFARLLALHGLARLVSVLLFGSVLFGTSHFVTGLLAWFLFAPRC
jgi:hypothetical protein